MATLTGPQIEAEIKTGNIKIIPFDPKAVNPNSVNLSLDRTLLVYDRPSWLKRWWMRLRSEPWCLDSAKANPAYERWIPPQGLILYPGMLYLGSTVEWTETLDHVPRIDGRSSIGRLGMCIHLTAGYGDISFRGKWTLEITVVHPVRVYFGMKLCQISYETVKGDIRPYEGKYQDSQTVISSRIYQEF